MELLKGKVALITGGGRGLGEAICRVLGSAGATVIVADIRLDLARGVSESLRSEGVQSDSIEVDLMQEKQIRDMFDQILKRHGRLDILVNNAAIDKTLSVEDLSVEDWDCVLAVNLRAPFITSKLAFSTMKTQGGGSIVNITSTAAKRAWPNASAYHATKWGLLGFSHSLHTEGRPLNIKVTAIVAGGMRTPFLLDRFPDIDIDNLQDPTNVAQTVLFVLTQPPETVIPEVTVLPLRETSWP